MRLHQPKILASLLALFALLYLIPLGARPLSSPDEHRYAEIPREMVASGDYVVPRLDGLVYFEKPVLGYWLVALSMAAFGPSAFAVRLPSALAAGATAALLYMLFVRMRRDAREAGLAAAAYLTCLLPFALGVNATLDAGFTCFVTATMAALMAAIDEETPSRRRRLLAAAGLAAGAAFLTKGPLGWVLPAIALLPWLAITRRLGSFARMAWLPALVAAAVAAPWAVAIHLRTEFWSRFIWIEHVQRFLQPGKDQHAQPIWYFALFIIPAAAPWICLAPSAAAELWRGRGGAAFEKVTFLFCWLALPFLFFSASSGKLLSYILPCMPPLLALIVLGSWRRAGEGRSRAARWASAANGAVAAIFLAILVFGSFKGEPALKAVAGGGAQAWLLAAGLATWAAAGAAGWASKRAFAPLVLVAASPVLFLLSVHTLSDGGPLHSSPEEILTRSLAEAGPAPALVADDTLVQALCWITRREDVEIFGAAGELAYGLEQSAGRHALAPHALGRLVELSERPVLLAMNSGKWDEIRAQLPAPDRLHRDHRYIVATFLPGGSPSAAQ